MIIEMNNQAITINHVGIVGWAGRDRQAVQAHIDELVEIGVKPPSSVPLVYRVSPHLLTQEQHVEFVGEQHSGEVEVCLLSDENQKLWITLASDHTDRQLEAYDVAFSKQVCAKPIATTAWLYEDVIGHWDELCVASQIREKNQTNNVIYQQGNISSLLHIADILSKLPNDLLINGKLKPSTILLCGTLSAIGGINCQANVFSMTLTDPVLDREISHTYQITHLPHNN